MKKEYIKPEYELLDVGLMKMMCLSVVKDSELDDSDDSEKSKFRGFSSFEEDINEY